MKDVIYKVIFTGDNQQIVYDNVYRIDMYYNAVKIWYYKNFNKWEWDTAVIQREDFGAMMLFHREEQDERPK